MAKRRPPFVTQVTDEPQMPVELRTRKLVEEWVNVDDVSAVRAKLADISINGRPAADDVQHVLWELRMRARSRARDARRRWATEHGLDANEAHRLIIAGGGLPHYRDESVFLAAIKRAIADHC